MTKVRISFEILEGDKHTPDGWIKVTGHLIFDVKMDFTRKTRWVVDGCKNLDSVGSTYTGIVLREIVTIDFTYAALTGLDVWVTDIQNAYLQAPSSQKYYIVHGDEFRLENVGKRSFFRRALYDGKSAEKIFSNHQRACMRHLNAVLCLEDPDVRMRPAIHSDGSTHYEYILLYTDDTLAIGQDSEKVLHQGIGKYFQMKEESTAPPKIYLGRSLHKVKIDNEVEEWAFGSSQYKQSGMKNVEEYLKKRNDPR
eukprot:15335744-Ditylum_brightwellii.AAC.1